jgi:hypothetical protein
MSGSFEAPIPEFVFTVKNEGETCSDVCPNTTDHLRLGPGLFDPTLAAALEVQPRTTGGYLFFYLELITGDPTSTFRHGEFNAPGVLDIEARPVPEPTVGALFGTACAMVMARRRRLMRSRRRRHSSSGAPADV